MKKSFAAVLMTAALAFMVASPALAESDLMRAMRKVSESTKKLSDSQRKLVEARRRYQEKMEELRKMAVKVAGVMRDSDARAQRPTVKKPVVVKAIPGSFTATPKPILRRPVAKKAALVPPFMLANKPILPIAKLAVAKKTAPAKKKVTRKPTTGRLAALKRPSCLASLRLSTPAKKAPGSIYESLTFEKKPEPGSIYKRLTLKKR